MLFLKKNPNLSHLSSLCSLPKTTTTSFYLHPFSSSSSTSKTLNPSPKSNPIAEFLTNSCGLSSHKAATTSKQIPISTSIEQARSVRHFFKHHGFADTQIPKLISGFPRILSADVDETLQPNFQILRELGFSETELQLVIQYNPFVLVNPLAIPSLQFWRNFLGMSKKKGLPSALSRQGAIDIVTGIAPKISLLKESGYSDIEIIHIVKRACCFIALLPLRQGLLSLSRIEWAAFDAKMEFFKGFGWSDTQFLAALGEAPDFIHLQEENIWEKMKFLVERAGCYQSYIVSNPSLLTLDLEKRLRPRYNIMEVLKSNRLVGMEQDLLFVMKLSEKDFVNRFVLRYQEKFPKLHDTYIAACAGRIPL